MFPVYGFMDSSSPHQRHQNGYQKSVPAYIPSKPPMAYESWPYGCNYGFPSPMPCVPSYNHGDMSGHHGFRPSCPPMMPPLMPYYTHYSTPYYPEPYPVYYVPQMPRNDYEKDRAWSRNHHCCECPNHQKEDTSMKIQEQEQKLNDWNGWLPLDMDKFKYLMNGEDAKRAREQKNEKRNMEEGDQKRQAPFPIIWMNPHYRRDDELGDEEGTEVNTTEKRHLGDGKSFENSKASTEKDILVNWIDPHKGEKKSEANEKKSPKLPPVCLRVDPLPKKNAKGCSRKKSSDAETSPSLSSESLDKLIVDKATDSTTKLEEEKFSDLKAALRIQSAFRGYEIRRSRPLEKLKQVAEIRKQMVDVRGGIQALESACSFREAHKQKLVLGETIMRLLLKLDTVQGLHPSIREVRKSLAKELVILQEKLDSLVIDEKSKVGFEGERIESELEKQQEPQEDRTSDDVADTNCNAIELGQDPALPLSDAMERSNGDENALVSEGDDLDDQVECDLRPEEPDPEAPMAQGEEFENVCATKSEINEVEKAPMEEEVQKDDLNSSDVNEFPKEVVDAETEDNIKQIEVDEDEEVKSATEKHEEENKEDLNNSDVNELPKEVFDVEMEDNIKQIEVEEDEEVESVTKKREEENKEDLNNSDVNEPKEVVDAETEDNIKQIEVDQDEEVKSATEKCEEENEEDQIQIPNEIEKSEETLQHNQIAKAKEEESEKSDSLISAEITIKSEETLKSTRFNTDMSIGKSEMVVDRFVEENEKLREKMEKLIETGQQQLNVILTLGERVKNLEKKLSKRKTKHGGSRGRRSVVGKNSSVELAL